MRASFQRAIRSQPVATTNAAATTPSRGRSQRLNRPAAARAALPASPPWSLMHSKAPVGLERRVALGRGSAFHEREVAAALDDTVAARIERVLEVRSRLRELELAARGDDVVRRLRTVAHGVESHARRDVRADLLGRGDRRVGRQVFHELHQAFVAGALGVAVAELDLVEPALEAAFAA